MRTNTIRINIVKKDKNGKNIRIAFSKSKEDILKASAEETGYDDIDSLYYREGIVQLIVTAFLLGVKEYQKGLKVIDQLEQAMEKFNADELNIEME